MIALSRAPRETYVNGSNDNSIEPGMRTTYSIAIVTMSAIVLGGCARERAGSHSEPEITKAIRFLEREVPAWSRDHGCFSCHNNGDAARALFAAKRAGFRVEASAVTDTIAWVTQPDRWEHNQGDPGFSDQRLANLQFASALALGKRKGTKDQSAMHQAARKVAAGQDIDGAWPIERQNPAGSPATYGTTLATWMALQVLRSSGARDLEAQVRKAETRLREVRLENTPNAATLLLFLAHATEATARKQRRDCLAFIEQAQTSDGGWGPYADAPAEVFDTALVLLALAEARREEGATAMIERGRAFLLKQQQADGSWPATTRPSGGESYAQQMSTTGWATLALLKTRER